MEPNYKKPWQRPEYYAYAVLYEGRMILKHMSLVSAKKHIALMECNLFEPKTGKFEIVNTMTGEIIEYKNKLKI